MKSRETIEVTDFGAGSRVFKTNRRSVAAIAKNAGITAKRQRLLFRLTRYLKPGHVLELGTSLGLATSALAMGHTSAQVVTVEGCPNTSEKARGLFDVFNLKNIQLNNETFEDFFRNNTTETYDLVYIDGNHNKERTLAYFEFLLNKTHNNSVFVFDDIYWSKAMSQAWETIIAHPKVTVSIDTFQWGLVFFRKEQQKEHFRIKV
jgi:predicted O-methyltransferase YrrM